MHLYIFKAATLVNSQMSILPHHSEKSGKFISHVESRISLFVSKLQLKGCLFVLPWASYLTSIFPSLPTL